MASSSQKNSKKGDNDDDPSKRVLDKDPDPPSRIGDAYCPPNTLHDGGGGSGDCVVRVDGDDGSGGEAAWGVINVRGASLPH